jgi:hypothetical protein
MSSAGRDVINHVSTGVWFIRIHFPLPFPYAILM